MGMFLFLVMTSCLTQLINQNQLSMRKITLFLTLFLFIGLQVIQAQNRTITGKVTSAEDGSALPGVTVAAKGTTIGTSTDVDGKYSLSVPVSTKFLAFSFIGMTTKEV